VHAIIVQADGKAVMGGDFTEINSQPCHCGFKRA
jgi:hypothetical protein